MYLKKVQTFVCGKKNIWSLNCQKLFITPLLEISSLGISLIDLKASTCLKSQHYQPSLKWWLFEPCFQKLILMWISFFHKMPSLLWLHPKELFEFETHFILLHPSNSMRCQNQRFLVWLCCVSAPRWLVAGPETWSLAKSGQTGAAQHVLAGSDWLIETSIGCQ